MALWSSANIYSYSNSTIKSTCEVSSQSRNGASQSYSIKITMWVTGNNLTSSTYNNKWTCVVKIGSKTIASALQVKGTTSGNILDNTYTATATGNITVSGDTGSTTLSVTYKDGTTGSTWVTKTATLTYNPLPVVSLAIQSYTNNTATLSYTYKNVAPTKVNVYQNGVAIKEITSTPFTITGLSPKTTYEFKGYGYANGAYGSNGNSVTLTTYPNPVTVSSVTVSNTQPFQATITVTSSSNTDTDSIEYAILNTNGDVIQSTTSTSYSWTPTGLSEETQYRFRIRMKTKTSNVWSSYTYSAYFTTPADQASIYLKNGSWLKGKVYRKESGVWVAGKKAYQKVNGAWVVGVNT